MAVTGPSPAAAQSAPPPFTWTGTWHLDWHFFDLTQTGQTVRGTWYTRAGEPTATVSGTASVRGGRLVLTADWAFTTPASRGQVELTLNDHGTRAFGRWGSAAGDLRDGRGATCVAGPCLARKIALPTFFGFQERVQRLTGDLAATARALGRRKDALESGIAADVARAKRALARQTRLATLERSLESRLTPLVAFLGRFDTVARAQRSDAKLRDLVAARRATDRAIVRHEQRILAAARRGGQAHRLRRELRGLQRALRDFERRISQRLPFAADRNRWARSVLVRRERLFELRRQAAVAEWEQRTAEERAGRKVAERGRIDVRLLELGEQLASADFDVREVVVEAGGVGLATDYVPVMRATGSSKLYERATELERRIESAREAAAKLDAARTKAARSFYDAHRAATASQARLANLLMRLAWARYFVDVGYAGLDVVLATAKGGPIGAVTEGAKKALEIGLSNAVAKPTGVEPGSIEAEINARYRAELQNSLGATRMARVAVERALKDGVVKRGKDALNAQLAPLMQKWVDHELTSGSGSSVLRRTPSRSEIAGFLRAHARIARMQRQADSLARGYRYGVADFGKGVMKDLSKTLLKGRLDRAERRAWIDFVEKDIRARTLYPLSRVAGELYWKAHDAHVALLHEKAKLLAGEFDPTSGLRRTLDGWFAEGARLRITLKVASRGSRPADVDVFVGDTRAAPVPGSPYTYVVAAADVEDGQRLRLQIR